MKKTNTKTKRNLKNKKRKTKKVRKNMKRGGEYIDSGTYGAVYANPRLLCEGENGMTPNINDEVSKIFEDDESAEKENNNVEKLKTFLQERGILEEFKEYAKMVIENAKILAQSFVDLGYQIISGGTDNHMMLIDLRAKDADLTGKLADETLSKCHITINKNTVPFETRSPFVTSGIRIGTSAITTRGMKSSDMPQIAELINYALMNRDNASKLDEVKVKVNALMNGFPLYA
jgi:glycine/serine hydroxymethyltransferase